MRHHKILVIDSGIGGLTVTAAIRERCPGVAISYVADLAYFPYGGKTEAEVTARIERVVAAAIQVAHPDLVVIACNTASTVALDVLRGGFNVPFVGVVPAIKPAATISQTGVIGVLATHGTINRRYTRSLIDTYARDVDVVLHGSSKLVELGERKLRGGQIDPQDVKAEIQGLMKSHDAMDTVVLACTHFPILKAELQSLMPNITHWIDSGEAIARRVEYLLNQLPQRPPIPEPANQLLLTAQPEKPYAHELISPLLGEAEWSLLTL